MLSRIVSIVLPILILASNRAIANASATADTNLEYPYPIVLLHGITSDKTELLSVANWLGENLPNQVYNIEIGNGKPDSIFKTMDWQLNQLCYEIYSIPELENGFHFIGMSQGGLLARGYVERCNKYPVINLITWVSPHAGVYGFDEKYLEFDNVYKPFYQNVYSFSGYWKDPYRYNMYLASASYLPYLNNEKFHTSKKYYATDILFNYEYMEDNYELIDWFPELNKDNMLSLKNFVMIWSPNDDVLSPPESGKFGYYKIMETILEKEEFFNGYMNGEPLPVLDLFDSDQFKEDWLGLRTLWETSRLHIFATNCTHSGHKTEECFPQLEELTFPFLV
jgi:palmitoyl-protein thioesterase